MSQAENRSCLVASNPFWTPGISQTAMVSLRVACHWDMYNLHLGSNCDIYLDVGLFEDYCKTIQVMPGLFRPNPWDPRYDMSQAENWPCLMASNPFWTPGISQAAMVSLRVACHWDIYDLHLGSNRDIYLDVGLFEDYFGTIVGLSRLCQAYFGPMHAIQGII